MPATVLEIDGLALLQIITHSHSHLPQMATGSLLGLSDPTTGVVKCTNSFALPDASTGATGSVVERGEDSDDDAVEPGTSDTLPLESEMDDDVAPRTVQSSNQYQNAYQNEMMKTLKLVNVDSNVVGWYQSMFLGTFCTRALIEKQLAYQTDLSQDAIVLLYDPVQTANNGRGDIVVKAFRLSKEFIAAKRANTKAYIDTKHVFEECAVKVTNQGLVRAMLFDMDRANKIPGKKPSALDNLSFGSNGDVDFDCLDLSTNPFLEKNLEYLSTWVDELSMEQSKFQLFARSLLKEEGGGIVQPIIFKRNQNPQKKVFVDKAQKWADPEAPNRLDALLSNLQISTYCDQVNEFADRSFNKMFIAGGLYKDGNGAE